MSEGEDGGEGEGKSDAVNGVRAGQSEERVLCEPEAVVSKASLRRTQCARVLVAAAGGVTVARLLNLARLIAPPLNTLRPRGANFCDSLGC